jgi:hypothetical protein
MSCFNIGSGHYNAGRYLEAAGWYKRAVEAMEYTMGPAHHSRTKKYRGWLKKAIDKMDPADAKTQEYQQFLEQHMPESEKR